MLNHSVMIATRSERRKAPTIAVMIVKKRPMGVVAIIPPYPTLDMVMIVYQRALDNVSKV